MRTHYDLAANIRITDFFAPGTVVLVKISVEKASHAHDCCQEEHLSVITQPGKVDSNLLSIVFPDKIQGLLFVYASRMSPLSVQKVPLIGAAEILGLTAKVAIMERESCLVDPRAYESVDPKLFYIVDYLIIDPRKDEVNNAASGGWIEERISILNIKVIHTVLLKWGSEKLLLWLDDTFIYLEDFGKPVEIVEG